MRMTCQFCNAPCFLVRKGDPDYSHHMMIWECRNHPPQFKVRHNVYVREHHMRGNYEVRGTSREWRDTIVTWKKGTAIYRAYFDRYTEGYRHVGVTTPGGFRVTIETPASRKAHKRAKDPWEHPIEKDAMEMENYPPWTLEQMPQKVETFIVFS